MSLILAHGLLYAGSPQWSNAAIFQIPHHHGLLRLSSRTGYTFACIIRRLSDVGGQPFCVDDHA